MTLIIVRKCNADHNDQRHDIKDNHTQNRKRQQRKMELIIQKSTELGASRFVPVALNRCIVKLSGKDAQKKIERWQKISEVAAKQCGRDLIPKIENIENEYASRLRIIPFTALGTPNGLLLGLKADGIKIEYDDEIIEHQNIIIGLYDKKLSKTDRYTSLIGITLIEGGKSENEHIRLAKI